MPTWGELIKELAEESQRSGGQVPFDAVRRRYIELLHKWTGRNTILYATKWTQPGESKPELISLTEEDIQGFMEVIYQLKGDKLDIILHSPGGSPEATEAIVTYLRSKFNDIRVIIPHAAMSAATMLACASNRIVMGKHSFIGPIDPQFILQTPLGVQVVPAQAIIDQFKRAQQECENPLLLNSWLPILSQFGPALLVQCQNALDMARELVGDWLTKYMFEGDQASLAREIAEKLSRHGDFKSHGRHISVLTARELGLKVDSLEEVHDFQERVLSVFHATMHTFSGTGAVKIIENQNGRAFIKMQQQVLIQNPSQQPPSRQVEPV